MVINKNKLHLISESNTINGIRRVYKFKHETQETFEFIYQEYKSGKCKISMTNGGLVTNWVYMETGLIDAIKELTRNLLGFFEHKPLETY